MFGRLFRSLNRLADNVNAFADTFGEANQLLRARLGMDSGEPELRMLPAAAEDEPQVIETPAPARKAKAK